MASINYTAKRNVSGGRTIGNNYSLTLNLVRFDRAPEPQKNTIITLNGTQYDNFHRLDIMREVQTAPENDAATLAQTREFLDSVAGGETFTIDSVNHKLIGSAKDTLVEMSGYYTFSFKAREQ